MLTNEQLVTFAKAKCKEKVKYCWGGFGKGLTKSLLSQLYKQYPNYYSTSRRKTLEALIGKGYKTCDCVGLLKWFLWTNGGKKSTITYNSKTDKGAYSWLTSAKTKGDISKIPEVKGLGLWMDGHFGIYIGNGKAVECTLGKYGDGVVETSVKGRGWEKWFYIPEIEYKTKTETKPKTEAKETLINMKVTAKIGLYFHNRKQWNSGTIVGCWIKGTKVQLVKGSEYKLGSYTGCKVKYKGSYYYCAKDFLK